MKFFKKLIHKLKLIKDIIFEPKTPVKVRDIDLDEINDRNDKIKELTRLQKEQNEKRICPNCGAKTDKIVKCEKCGKEICEECGTYCSGSNGEDIQTEKTGYYCDECW